MEYPKRFNMPPKEELMALTGVIILDKMIQRNREFSTLLEGDDTHLEDTLRFLSGKGLFDVDIDTATWKVTSKGQEVYHAFLKKYADYLKVYDVFCAVDLKEGRFGFERYFDYEEGVFRDYIHDERFSDLRVTVCEYKKINPFEIVFISFLIEKRFREPKNREIIEGTKSWQYACVYGSVFEEILKICNRSLHFQELGYVDNQGQVSGEMVIRDVITQGTDLARAIALRKVELAEEEEEFLEDERLKRIQPQVSTQRTVEQEYQPYYDPYYRSPVWDLALLSIILL